jgi:hypothetical protein
MLEEIYKVELENNIIFYTRFKCEIANTINEIYGSRSAFINIGYGSIRDYIKKTKKDDNYVKNMIKHKRNNLCVIKKITAIPYKLFLINDFKKKNGNKLPIIRKHINKYYNKLYNELYNEKKYGSRIKKK